MVTTLSEQEKSNNLVDQDQVFMDTTALSEVVSMANYLSGDQIGNIHGNVNRLMEFSKGKMELNDEKV